MSLDLSGDVAGSDDARLPFDILYYTSDDDHFPITELYGGEDGKDAALRNRGWQSARNPKTPQTLVLRLQGNAKLTRLTILSHECMISSKVEVRVFALKGEQMLARPPSFRDVRFTKLGSVSFSSNEQTNFRSKERKTIHVSTEAYYIKLLFQQPYTNDLNRFNQVGVYMISCFGKLLNVVEHHVDTAVSVTNWRSSLRSSSLVPAAASQQKPTSASLHRLQQSASAVERSSGSRPGSILSQNGRNGSARRAPPTRGTSWGSLLSREKLGDESGAAGEEEPADYSKAPRTNLPRVMQQPHVSNRLSAGRNRNEESHGGSLHSFPLQLSHNTPLEVMLRGAPTESPPFRSVRIIEFDAFFVERSSELLQLKEEAITVEDFGTAALCRDRWTLMSRLYKRVHQLEQDKVQAIIEEDFNAAQVAKVKMDSLVERIYKECAMPQPRPDFDPAQCVPDISLEDTQQLLRQQWTTLPTFLPTAQGVGSLDRDDSPSVRGNPRGYMVSVHGADDGNSGGEPKSPHDDDKKRHWAGKGTQEPLQYDEIPIKSILAQQRAARLAEHFDKADGADGAVESSLQSSPRTEPRRSLSRKSSDATNATSRRSGEQLPPLVSRDSPSTHPRSRASNGSLEGDAGWTPTAFPVASLDPWEQQVQRAIVDEAGPGEEKPVESQPPGADARNAGVGLDSTVGVYTSLCLRSRRFKLREAALRVLTKHLGDLYRAGDLHPAPAVDAVLRFLDFNGFGLQDKLPSVVAASCGFINMVLDDSLKCLQEVLPALLNLLPRLMSRMADPRWRQHSAVTTLIRSLVVSTAVPSSALIGAILAPPIDREKHAVQSGNASVQLARLSAVDLLLKYVRVPPSSSALQPVLRKVLLPAVNHKSVEVRDAAMPLLDGLIQRRLITPTDAQLRSVIHVAVRNHLREAISAAYAEVGETTPTRGSSITPSSQHTSGSLATPALSVASTGMASKVSAAKGSPLRRAASVSKADTGSTAKVKLPSLVAPPQPQRSKKTPVPPAAVSAKSVGGTGRRAPPRKKLS